MADIVELRPKAEELVWTCGHCKCVTFRLFSTGEVECANCMKRDCGCHWRRQLPEPDGQVVLDDTADTKVVSFGGTPAMALREMMRKVDVDRLQALIAIETNSRVRTWGGINSVEQIDWLDNCLANASELLKVPITKEEPR